MAPVFKSIFPYDQSVVAEYPVMTEKDIASKIANAEKAFDHWSNYSFAQRSDVLLKAALLLRAQKEELARIITQEMGKLTREAVGEIEKCAACCEYYAANAEEFLKDEPAEAGYTKSFVAYQPIGAVFAIMPWNFPFWQVFRFAAPALMAGNVALLKHAPNVCGCSLAIEKIFTEAGAPQGVFQSLIVDVDVTERIISERIVQAITLTGSEMAGSIVSSIASKHIKKSVLELGGSDAFIVLPDADMEKAVSVAMTSRFQNAGQSCIAAKRFLIVEGAEDAFRQQLNIQFAKIKQGNPFLAETTAAPMARLDLADKLKQQLNNSVTKGAVLNIGGGQNGCNFNPAFLSNVHEGMPAFDEETFGPVLAMITVKNEEEAIQLANKSDYGLGGSIWTKDIDKGIALARRINTGAVFINSLVKSDPRLPFGGVKRSGFGRELGRHGILEFVNIKTIAAESA